MSDAALRLLAAFIMLIIGFAIYVLADRVAYRPLRHRYERRKAMGRRGVEPYSTMKPATSSDSASTRSKGGRLVSASAET